MLSWLQSRAYTYQQIVKEFVDVHYSKGEEKKEGNYLQNYIVKNYKDSISELSCSL